MKRSIALSLSGLVLMLAGCETVPSDDKTVPPTSASAAVAAGLSGVREGLPPQELQVGECGLFLWTRREQPQFVFFSKSGEETAKFWTEGREIALDRTGLGGEIFGQQLTEQDFSDAAGKTYELRMTPGDLLVSGQRVPEATITVMDAEGWKTLIPLAGVSACQPAP